MQRNEIDNKSTELKWFIITVGAPSAMVKAAADKYDMFGTCEVVDGLDL